jgi:hypothetical protein
LDPLASNGDSGYSLDKIYPAARDRSGNRSKVFLPKELWLPSSNFDQALILAHEIPQFKGWTGVLRTGLVHMLKYWQPKLANKSAYLDMVPFDIINEANTRDSEETSRREAQEVWLKRWKSCPESKRPIELLHGQALHRSMLEHDMFDEASDLQVVIDAAMMRRHP